ncbi:hypothetical protein SD427_13840 [Chryseobacterium sp. JJR-5R]|uniref:hypothetical protein n=1 Tax=Chryseobacterium sp. JJR-5R TaxID=3093923 RepID=UPI002A752F31|nr:hypothetical protein [Chryseobacterium sp. JJR-5R]WPO81846.1 hypothetical protein SD427_13840 [Chryseobacterium sp. JJR-5R]
MKSLFVILLLTVSAICFGQKSQMKTEYAKYRQNKGGYWTEWSGLKKTSVTVTINADEQRIIVHSSPQETYKILDFKPTQYIDDSLVQDYYCVDSSGKKCTVTFVISKNENAIINLRYNNWEYIYSGSLL